MAEINLDNRSVALKQEPKVRKNILPFATKFNPAAPNIKSIIMKNWYLIQNQPELNATFPEPPTIAYKKEQSLEDLLVRTKL